MALPEPADRALAARVMRWALALLGACVVAESVRHAQQPAATAQRLALPAAAATAPLEAPPRLKLRSVSTIPMPAGVASAHASALAAFDDAEVIAFWWAGTRESAADVAIYASRWKDGVWSAARCVVERGELSRQLGFGVRRLGNPAAWVARDGRVHLYAVATGLGGWAASRVVHLVSDDRGGTFVAQRVLPLSPLFNTSVLVRTHPVALADGGWLLPAYFELGNKYPMLLTMDAQGRPLRSVRIGASRTSLQPALLPVSATELHALMRDHGASRRIQRATSADAGVHWQGRPALGLRNDDSSIAAIRLADGGFVLAHNDALPEPATPRQWLRLSSSTDAVHWGAAQDVRRGAPGDEFSYPSLLQVGAQLHLSFTLMRGAIEHHVYDIVVDGAPRYARAEPGDRS